MNAPFSIGQKVVCLRGNWIYKKGLVYTVAGFFKCPDCGKLQIGCEELPLLINDCSCPCGGVGKSSFHWQAFASRFAPIQTNYADATAEILEKFKSPEDTPDKILIPEKLKSIP